jgi:cell fate regulator YaaT (PSP1 superfamily)
MAENNDTPNSPSSEPEEERVFYRIRFRQEGQEFTAEANVKNLSRNDTVMVKTDHGLEPAMIAGKAPACADSKVKRGSSFRVARPLTGDEVERYANLPSAEENGFNKCNELITKHSLTMSLVRVEKFFNGSKMIFYFTADNRVDFRELVKDLVQEFRTRVEMRQVGVRHETKMLGGLGTCGRELCCSSYMKKFDSVSIKMAKEQDLPLNPSKISGVCNRLLCCLTYEFAAYHELRKKMPKIGSWIKLENVEYRVKQQMPLPRRLVVVSREGEERTLEEKQWLSAEKLKSEQAAGKKKKKK